MPKYKKIPPPEILKVHGELGLKRGWYKTGGPLEPVTDDDIILKVYPERGTLTAEYSRGGKYHREDGPAIIQADGTIEWWLHGKCHREDGPAVIRADGRTEWWLQDKLYTTQKEYEAALKKLKKKGG